MILPCYDSLRILFHSVICMSTWTRKLSPYYHLIIELLINELTTLTGILQFETMPASGDSSELTFAVLGDLGTYVTNRSTTPQHITSTKAQVSATRIYCTLLMLNLFKLCLLFISPSFSSFLFYSIFFLKSFHVAFICFSYSTFLFFIRPPHSIFLTHFVDLFSLSTLWCYVA